MLDAGPVYSNSSLVYLLAILPVWQLVRFCVLLVFWVRAVLTSRDFIRRPSRRQIERFARLTSPLAKEGSGNVGTLITDESNMTARIVTSPGRLHSRAAYGLVLKEIEQFFTSSDVQISASGGVRFRDRFVLLSFIRAGEPHQIFASQPFQVLEAADVFDVVEAGGDSGTLLIYGKSPSSNWWRDRNTVNKAADDDDRFANVVVQARASHCGEAEFTRMLNNVDPGFAARQARCRLAKAKRLKKECEAELVERAERERVRAEALAQLQVDLAELEALYMGGAGGGRSGASDRAKKLVAASAVPFKPSMSRREKAYCEEGDAKNGEEEAAEEEDTQCTICLGEYEEGELVTAFPCGGKHRFHKDCLLPWLANKNTCPLCRHPLEQCENVIADAARLRQPSRRLLDLMRAAMF